MRIVIINLIIISLLIILTELTIRILKISQVQGVERNLFNLEGEIVLNRSNTDAVIFGKKAYIDKKPRELDRPSDHAPVIAEF